MRPSNPQASNGADTQTNCDTWCSYWLSTHIVRPQRKSRLPVECPPRPPRWRLCPRPPATVSAVAAAAEVAAGWRAVPAVAAGKGPGWSGWSREWSQRRPWTRRRRIWRCSCASRLLTHNDNKLIICRGNNETIMRYNEDLGLPERNPTRTKP